ncbi:MAG: hypothetical protein K0R38_6818, partial [Polyangiaceae bacterium]|nr:hypothetical protein [Polyangiaceae bacterium]
MSARRLLPLALVLLTAVAACKKPTTDGKADDTTKPKAAELPPLEVKADTPNLLITWVDDKG